MLAQQIIAVLSFAMVAVASPLEARTKPKTGPEAAQACGNNFKPSCCNTTQKSGLLPALLDVVVGINCTPINVLSVLPITSQCNAQTVCCQSGKDSGNAALINVQNVCPQVL
ncbi:MAG: hypothetical protein M1835_007926 [Candelina submexicana]|nr:MAG: hypothetical protein M1835_007926 [Candelina submexicana]